MELLAPAGSFAAFEAAVAEGADAVYLGAPELNARAPARDFTFPEIGSLIRYGHQAGVKVFIAMNSLVKEAELPLAVESLSRFAAYEADAVILQDLGLLHLARTCFPNLKLHASTLMTVHNSVGVKTLVDMGCTRIVLPRELTIKEIGDIFRKTGAELEVFVHGAMCFSYSGLCLFSSLHGGKSSLRGHCVQPCRRRYSWLRKRTGKGHGPAAGKGGGYLFSMNDLSGIELLPELANAGVASLKIEGRLKSAEYVRKTVRAYRLLLDNLDNTAGQRQRQETARRLLDEAMGRRRATGFFLDRRAPEATTPHFSGNVGLMVGKVHAVETRSPDRDGAAAVLTVSLRHSVREGDRLRLHNELTGERTGFTLRSLRAGGRKIRKGDPGQTVRIGFPRHFHGQSGKKFPGSLFKVDIGGGRLDEKKARDMVLASAAHTIVPDRGEEQAILKEVAATSLLPGVRQPSGAEQRHSGRRQTAGPPQWWVKVNVFRDMRPRLPMEPGKYILPVNEENIEYGGHHAARYTGRVVWSLPPIIPEHRLEWYYDAAALLIGKGYRYFMIAHLPQLELLRNISGPGMPLEVYGDYTVNALNSLALGKIKLTGLAGTLFSIETDRENLLAALQCLHHHIHDFAVGLYAYGRPPLFTARLDARHFEYGKRFLSPKREEYTLSRTDEMTLARAALPYSLLGEWKNLARSGVEILLVDLSFGSMKKNLSEIVALYGGKDKPASMSGNYFTVLT